MFDAFSKRKVFNGLYGGSVQQEGYVPPPPEINYLLLGDGVSFLVLGDGASKLIIN